MAKKNEVKIIIKGDDKSKKAFNTASKSVSNFAKKNNATFKKMAMGGVAALTGLIAVGNKMVGLANNQIEQEKKLAVVLKQRTNATDEQIDSIKRLASEQQKLGVIGDEIQLAGAQQLATFVKQTESVENLLPAMNNLVVQQKGVNATQEDMINIANLMGKAMDGQVGALSRVGISFSDAQAEILKTGNEMERSAVLAEVITGNVGEMNKALAQTTAGRMASINNTLGDIGETIGKALLPIIETLLEKITPLIAKFGEWVEKNPELVKKIFIITGAVAGLSVVLGVLGMALPAIITGITLLTGPIGLVIAGIVALGLARKTDFLGMKTTILEFVEYVKPLVIGFVSVVKEVFGDMAITIQETFSQVFGESTVEMENFLAGVKVFLGFMVENFKVTFETVLEIVKVTLQVVGTIIETIIKVIGGLVSFVRNVFAGEWRAAREDVKGIFSDVFYGIYDIFNDVINSIIGGVSRAVNTIKSLVSFGKSEQASLDGGVSTVGGTKTGTSNQDFLNNMKGGGGTSTSKATSIATTINLNGDVNASDQASADKFISQIDASVKTAVKNAYKSASLGNT